MSVASSPVNRQRIDLLDAYRAIAIAWVAMFHFGYFWTSIGEGDDILPYDAAFGWLPLSSVGYLGVSLFFMISGYVIALTLQNTPNLVTFLVKRFARLWPTLIFCGAITFVTVNFMGPPELKRSISEALISMTLIPPSHVGMVTGNTHWQWLDGAYWSLWVEVKFYVIIGIIFFSFPKRWFELWLGYEALALTMSASNWIAPNLVRDVMDGLMFGAHVPFFTLGMASYRYRTGTFGRVEIAAILLALGHLIFNLSNPNVTSEITSSLLIGYAVVFVLFGLFTWRPTVLSWLESKVLLRIGRSSYSFYLLHQVVGISVLVTIGSMFGTTASMIAMPFVLGALILISMQIFDHIEQPANRWINEAYKARTNDVPAKGIKA